MHLSTLQVFALTLESTQLLLSPRLERRTLQRLGGGTRLGLTGAPIALLQHVEVAVLRVIML